MFVVVTENHTSETLLCRRMGPHEKLNARAIAEKLAASMDLTVAPADGHIPAGCGEIRVEFRPRRDDSLCIWSGEDFFFRNIIED